MRPKRKDIQEIRQRALYLNGLCCQKNPPVLPKPGKVTKNYQMLYELISRYEHLLREGGQWFSRDLEFGVEVLQDTRVQRLCTRTEKRVSRSVRAISVPFESHR